MTDKSKQRLHLTSLLRVEERLMEAEYFGRRMFDLPNSTVLGYELNAFLSAARSVTFLLQKEFAAVDGFEAWWIADRAKLGADAAARFFLELRNFSQKQGRVSIVGTSDQDRKWRYMFAGTAEPVPAVLSEIVTLLTAASSIWPNLPEPFSREPQRRSNITVAPHLRFHSRGHCGARPRTE